MKIVVGSFLLIFILPFLIKITNRGLLRFAFILLLLLISSSAAAAHRPFPQSIDFSDTIKPNNITQIELNNSVKNFYNLWQSCYLKASNGTTPNGGYYVEMHGTGGDGNEKTTSEAMGYGMIICALMSDAEDNTKNYFDGMFNMYDYHRSSINQNLMSWKIDQSETSDLDSDSATDGDLDIAYALLLAHVQWKSDGKINYLAEAWRILNHGIKISEIDSNSLRTRLGDWDFDSWSSRPSDWMTGHFHTFYDFTRDKFWLKVADEAYNLISSLNAGVPQTGLLPDFIVGEIPQPAPANSFESNTDGDYSWNACRVPWRLSLDWAHHKDSRAYSALALIMRWIKAKTGNDPAQITAGYKLNGTSLNDYKENAFTAPLVCAAIIDRTYQQFLNQGWPLLNSNNSYFNDSLSLLSQLVISGNWWNPEVRSSEISYHVDPTGDDTGPGTLTYPWKTIQKSAESATPGSKVYIHGGRYFEIIDLKVSGIPGQFITWCNYDEQPVIIDGSQSRGNIMLRINGQSYLKIKGLQLTNFIGNDRDGVRIENGASHIEFSNNKISHIYFSDNVEAPINENTNVRPFIVLGNNPNLPCQEIRVTNNEIFSCRTGFSEGLALNGNVENFTVSFNQVHDISNIGIVFIGHEETAPLASVDQARYGLCSHNKVYNCQSPYAAAAGIYVDGARDLVIENNQVYNCQWGIEIGCEHPGKSADDICVRNNLIYHNRASGIACGGYDYPDLSGTVNNCLISNNTCYHNDLDDDWNGELNFSHADACLVVNNNFVADTNNPLIYMNTPETLTNTFNFNLWYTGAEESFLAEVNGVEYHSLEAYQNATNQGNNSLYADPKLLDPEGSDPDFHLSTTSPSINRGDPLFSAARTETDLDGGIRIIAGRIDIGVDEYANEGTCPYPCIKTGSNYYASIEKAYQELENGAILLVKSDELIDVISDVIQLNRDDDPQVKIIGGCDCSFIPCGKQTSLCNKLIISNGCITVEGLIIGPKGQH